MEERAEIRLQCTEGNAPAASQRPGGCPCAFGFPECLLFGFVRGDEEMSFKEFLGELGPLSVFACSESHGDCGPVGVMVSIDGSRLV